MGYLWYRHHRTSVAEPFPYVGQLRLPTFGRLQLFFSISVMLYTIEPFQKSKYRIVRLRFHAKKSQAPAVLYLLVIGPGYGLVHLWVVFMQRAVE